MSQQEEEVKKFLSLYETALMNKPSEARQAIRDLIEKCDIKIVSGADIQYVEGNPDVLLVGEELLDMPNIHEFLSPDWKHFPLFQQTEISTAVTKMARKILPLLETALGSPVELNVFEAIDTANNYSSKKIEDMTDDEIIDCLADAFDRYGDTTVTIAHNQRDVDDWDETDVDFHAYLEDCKVERDEEGGAYLTYSYILEDEFGDSKTFDGELDLSAQQTGQAIYDDIKRTDFTDETEGIEVEFDGSDPFEIDDNADEWDW